MHEFVIKMQLNAWEAHIKKTTSVFNSFAEDDLNKEIAPGKNRVIYLMGHLTAVHDAMFPLLGLGDKNYLNYEELFINKPDKEVVALPSIKELKKAWEITNQHLSEKFRSLSPAEWMQKHTAISEEEFLKEPHRNRLNVLISRTNHLAYHLGQLVLAQTTR